MYFLFFKLHDWGKRFAAQPQTIYSEVPQEPKTDRKKHFGCEKKKDLPNEEGLKRCSNTPDGHFSARPIPRDPGISPCTNDRQVSWLSGHHSTAPSHFRNGILRYYSPVHSDEIVQDLHLFPFYPLTHIPCVSGTHHFAYSVLFYCSTLPEKSNLFLPRRTVEICRILSLPKASFYP